MPAPNARQLEQRAEEARAIADQMRDPLTKRSMANLALSYERLAKHAGAREVSDSKESRTVLYALVWDALKFGHNGNC
jgi:hypothetical protein